MKAADLRLWGALLLLVWLAAPYWPTTVDDVYISVGFAQQWADTGALTWVDGARVEGYSNFLWVALLALATRIGTDPGLLAQLLALAAAGGVLAVLHARLPRGGPGTLALLATAGLAPLSYWLWWGWRPLCMRCFSCSAGAPWPRQQTDATPGPGPQGWGGWPWRASPGSRASDTWASRWACGPCFPAGPPAPTSRQGRWSRLAGLPRGTGGLVRGGAAHAGAGEDRGPGLGHGRAGSGGGCAVSGRRGAGTCAGLAWPGKRTAALAALPVLVQGAVLVRANGDWMGHGRLVLPACWLQRPCWRVPRSPGGLAAVGCGGGARGCWGAVDAGGGGAVLESSQATDSNPLRTRSGHAAR